MAQTSGKDTEEVEMTHSHRATGMEAAGRERYLRRQRD